MKGRLRFLLISSLLLLSSTLFAQQKKEAKDSLIRLIEASSAQLQEVDGISYRKILGPAARFFHNNTYLVCDTALWNVNTNVIKALGNVQILQENTFLKSDKIDYIIDQDLAQFRGSLVELFDKEGNVLRTNYLDYNTKDSIATFYGGGAMKNADGNLIESRNGEYRAADKIFSFKDNVQMFTDSVFIKSHKVDYNTVENKAYFGKGTTAWQEDNMLFANMGDFDREGEIFNFSKDSYILTKDQELWADTLTYYKASGVATLTNNIQILDTVQKSFCFADWAQYTPEPMKIRLTRNPSVAMYTVENGVKDTLFLAADTIDYYTINYCDIDAGEISKAKERKRLSDLDPLAKIEADGAARRKENEDAVNSPFIKGAKGKDKGKDKGDDEGDDKVPGVFTTSVTDTLSSLKVPVADSTSVVVDSTAVTFIDAWHKVKVFKNDIQALCDSLVYTGLDSMARMYVNPVMWNDVKHQFTADSIQIVMKDNVVSKANLISEAFIASQEDTVHFNQIKGAEMVAYFSNNDLSRYDALGGASMIFYVEEDSLITMMNQKEGKIISARLQDRKIQRIKYFENLKNNLMPVFNLPAEEQRLRGFNWRGDERPQNRFIVTDRIIKESQRDEIQSTVFPDYPFTKVYFAATRDSIMLYKAQSDSLRLAKALSANAEDPVLPSDSLDVIEPSVAGHDVIEKAETDEGVQTVQTATAAVQATTQTVNTQGLDAQSSIQSTVQSTVQSATQSAGQSTGQAISKTSESPLVCNGSEDTSAKLEDDGSKGLLSKDEIRTLDKSERKKVKKEQRALRKALKAKARKVKRQERAQKKRERKLKFEQV